jgi:hypothetical protein
MYLILIKILYVFFFLLNLTKTYSQVNPKTNEIISWGFDKTKR